MGPPSRGDPLSLGQADLVTGVAALAHLGGVGVSDVPLLHQFLTPLVDEMRQHVGQFEACHGGAKFDDGGSLQDLAVPVSAGPIVVGSLDAEAKT